MRLAFALTIFVMVQLLITATGDFRQIGLQQAFAAKDDGAYTPPPGSAERKAIMDAYRKKWKQQGGNEITDVVFVVNNLKVHNGWAWLDVKPQSSNGSQQYEGEQGLLRRKNGQWKVLERTAGADQSYFKKLKSKYPSLPTDIFQ